MELYHSCFLITSQLKFQADLFRPFPYNKLSRDGRSHRINFWIPEWEKEILKPTPNTRISHSLISVGQLAWFMNQPTPTVCLQGTPLLSALVLSQFAESKQTPSPETFYQSSPGLSVPFLSKFLPRLQAFCLLPHTLWKPPFLKGAQLLPKRWRISPQSSLNSQWQVEV